MSFKCKDCGREVSNAEMIGLAIGHAGREAATRIGINQQQKGDVLAGLLNGLRVPCPKCESSNWKYEL